MHDSSAMPFVHVGLVAIVLLAFVVLVTVRKFGSRNERRKASEPSMEEEIDHD
jgi:hypothetical protein